MAKPWIRSAAAVVVVAIGMSACAARAPKAEPSATGVRPSGVAVAAKAADATPTHVMVAPSGLKWQPFPPGAPGVSIAIVSGDPEKPGPFVVRIKSPAGAKVPPHWHPTDESVTVISGTFALGMGDKFDPKALKSMPPGSFALMPREMRHFALSKTATVVQVHGNGPFVINFVNPADDPRTKQHPTR